MLGNFCLVVAWCVLSVQGLSCRRVTRTASLRDSSAMPVPGNVGVWTGTATRSPAHARMAKAIAVSENMALVYRLCLHRNVIIMTV